MNIRMARRCLNGGCQEAIQCPEGRCALHAAMSAPVPRNEGAPALAAPEAAEPVADVDSQRERTDPALEYFADWWRLQTMKGDPSRRPNLTRDAYVSGHAQGRVDERVSGQAGRDAVEAFTDRQCLLLSFRLRRDVEDVEAAVDRFIEHGAKCAVEKCISEVRAALSIATGRAAE